MPFARSCITKLKKLGLPYANQSYEVDGVSIKVRVEPGHEYIRLEGGAGEVWIAVEVSGTVSPYPQDGSGHIYSKLFRIRSTDFVLLDEPPPSGGHRPMPAKLVYEGSTTRSTEATPTVPTYFPYGGETPFSGRTYYLGGGQATKFTHIPEGCPAIDGFMPYRNSAVTWGTVWEQIASHPHVVRTVPDYWVLPGGNYDLIYPIILTSFADTHRTTINWLGGASTISRSLVNDEYYDPVVDPTGGHPNFTWPRTTYSGESLYSLPKFLEPGVPSYSTRAFTALDTAPEVKLKLAAREDGAPGHVQAPLGDVTAPLFVGYPLPPTRLPTEPEYTYREVGLVTQGGAFLDVAGNVSDRRFAPIHAKQLRPGSKTEGNNAAGTDGQNGVVLSPTLALYRRKKPPEVYAPDAPSDTHMYELYRFGDPAGPEADRPGAATGFGIDLSRIKEIRDDPRFAAIVGTVYRTAGLYAAGEINRWDSLLIPSQAHLRNQNTKWGPVLPKVIPPYT